MNSVLQETRSARTTRRALNDLQYSPNGKTIAGIQMSPRKYIEADPLKPGRILFDNNLNTSQLNRPLKKRTSISLPDICSTAKSLSVSQVSTPSKSKTTSTQNTPFKSGRKDISIILEEKENPNSTFHLDKNSICYGSYKNLTKLRETIKEEKAESKECSIQCNKSDEDMLLSDNVDSTPYWRLLTYKRFKCLQETLKENHEVNIICKNQTRKY